MYYTRYFKEVSSIEVQQVFAEWLKRKRDIFSEKGDSINIISHSIACDPFGNGAWVISVLYKED